MVSRPARLVEPDFSDAKQRANNSRDYLAALTSNQTRWIGLPHSPAPKLFRGHPRSKTDLQATYRTLLIPRFITVAENLFFYLPVWFNDQGCLLFRVTDRTTLSVASFASRTIVAGTILACDNFGDEYSCSSDPPTTATTTSRSQYTNYHQRAPLPAPNRAIRL
jgi:hypothetical protein